MSQSTDWMPRRREEQLAMAKTWVRELPRSNGAWDMTITDIYMLNSLVSRVDAAQAAALTGGPAEQARLREAFLNLVRFMRYIHSRKFFKPPMTDPDYVRLGLRPPDVIRTGHTIVNELVEFEIRLRGIRELVVDFRIKGAAHKAKPAGCEGAVIVWDVLDVSPEQPTDLANHTMASRTPYVIEFDETERGKTAYIAIQWQNERGITGPWSETLTAVIP